MNRRNNIGERRRMIEYDLKQHGIHDPSVLKAFEKIDRADFVPEQMKNEAYGDFPLPIGHSQTISQPYIIASMLQMVKPSKGKNVLEVGTGSGYQTALLAILFDNVYTIEYLGPLQEKAKQALEKYSFSNIKYKIGDGKEGWDDYAPFDSIIVSAAAYEIPDPLKEQLSVGGYMAIPVGGFIQQLVSVHRKNEKEYETTRHGGCRFVRLQ